MTVEELNIAWVVYKNTKSSSERFGQYLANKHNIELADSYYIEDDNYVYELVLSALGGWNVL